MAQDTDSNPAGPPRFVERFASAMVTAGMPRMPARVMSALLATDPGRLTATELAQQLEVSPAAVSGAVRYLAQVGMITTERPPGSRRDHYRIRASSWYDVVLRRERLVLFWMDTLREGIEEVGAGTPAGARLAETLAFFEFLQAQMEPMMERWKVVRDELRERLGITDQS
jgi:DNA-binding transcriptional regulator GbsR (MarR family)